MAYSAYRYDRRRPIWPYAGLKQYVKRAEPIWQAFRKNALHSTSENFPSCLARGEFQTFVDWHDTLSIMTSGE